MEGSEQACLARRQEEEEEDQRNKSSQKKERAKDRETRVVTKIIYMYIKKLGVEKKRLV